MKKALLVLLVVVIVVTGLPIPMGMSGMATCPDCDFAMPVGPACTVAILAAGVALAVAMLSRRLRRRDDVLRLLLRSFLLERPPQLV